MKNRYLCGYPEIIPMTFTGKLIAWYNRNKRDLPWRTTKDPYLIWLSEIILQQTRVEQGLPYYHKFIASYPAIKDLAMADEQSILKLWQGLGYYSRARNLYAAAKEITTRMDSVFPSSYESILKLKGVGEYTAAAIASISFGLPYPVTDGNVLRFFSRYFGILEPINSTSARKKVYLLAKQHIDTDDPGTFNQAMMEFGALCCKPADPDCIHCIFRKQCFALIHGLTERIPVRPKTIIRRERYFHYFFIRLKGKKSVYLKKREKEDIWKNLFDFPMIETPGDILWEDLIRRKDWKEIFDNNVVTKHSISDQFKHLLTHQSVIARFYEIEVSKPLASCFMLIKLRNLKKYPYPRLIERFLLSLPSDRN